MDPARGAKLSTWLNDQRVRGLIYQILLLACVAALAYGAIHNALTNMRARGMPMGFGFWNQVAGFDINLHLINYSNLSTYGRAFWVGLLNTLLIAVICIPLATLLGFAIGVARLSPNWLLSRLALVYTSVLRNIPLLLLLLFWYNAVLKSLPGPRQSITLGDVVFLNNRGLYLPMPVPRDQAVWFMGAIVAALVLAAGFREWARRRQETHRRAGSGGRCRRRIDHRVAGDRMGRGRRAVRVRCRETLRFQHEGWAPDHSRNGRARFRSRHFHGGVHR